MSCIRLNELRQVEFRAVVGRVNDLALAQPLIEQQCQPSHGIGLRARLHPLSFLGQLRDLIAADTGVGGCVDPVLRGFRISGGQ